MNECKDEFPLLDKLVEDTVFPAGIRIVPNKTEAEKLADQHSVAIMELLERIKALEEKANKPLIGKEG